MSFLEGLLDQRKLVLTLAVLMALLGAAAWMGMNRQEDPLMPDYWGQVVVTFPGADAETVERLVLDRLEEALAAVDEVRTIDSTAYAGIATLHIELRDDLRGASHTAAENAWDEVRKALEQARLELPEGVGPLRLDDRLNDQEGIVYALTGHPDPLELARVAEQLKDELLSLPEVAKVHVVADPGEQVFIELDDAAARRLGLTPGHLAAQLRQRNQILPGGSVQLADRSVSLRPQSEFESLEEIRRTPITLSSGGVAGSGESVPLNAVARVRRGPEEPVASRMRFDGREAVGIGVVPRRGVNVVSFGEQVREKVDELAPQFAPVAIEEVVFQPDRVRERLTDLGRSLLLGMLIVAGVLVLAMGLRLGLVVASVVPLVALSSLAVYAVGGGVLHQISIAALVIALGMLVDNAVVVAENVQWRLDRGEPRSQAVAGAVRELAVPLAAATGTTIAAFVPMFVAKGSTAEFTRAIPVVIILTLSMSYLFATLVTPALSQLFLKPQPHSASRFERLAAAVAAVPVRRPGRVLLAGLLAVGVSVFAAGWVRLQFFPSSDRNLVVVSVKLPEGSHLEATDARAAKLERAFMERPEATRVATFVGRSTPHFYYNLQQIPWSPHLAQLVVGASSRQDVDALLDWVREYAEREMPDVEIVASRLEQGPPVLAPVEVRLYGDDLSKLREATDAVLAEVRKTPGTKDVRHTLSTGAPVLRFEVDDAAAARRGLSRMDVATSLFGRTRGLPVGTYRAEEDPIPVVLRSSAGEDFPVDGLGQIDVSTPGGEPVPLAQVARTRLEWRPAAIQHRNGRRVASVLAQLAPGATYSDALASLLPRLDRLEPPAGVSLELGGEAEGSQEANGAMAAAMPFGVLLLLGILMAEFRSYRRVVIVLTTVPLAITGVVPGLLLGDEPFGFMSLLGVIALVGVVVNNAIVLLEVVEGRRREGADVAQALRDAVERRVRPILLATATTVAGLLPLAFSGSTMWPPMAWTMISGLVASTLLTLLVVPALYLLLFEPRTVFSRRSRRESEWDGAEAQPSRATAGLAGLLLLALLGVPLAARAQEPAPLRLTLAEALDRAVERPRAQAAESLAAAAEQLAVAERRAALWPSLTATASVSDQDRELELRTPVGSFNFGSSRSEDASLTLTQPLLEPARRFYGAPAARAEAEAEALSAGRVRQLAAGQAANAFLDVLAIDAQRGATASFIASLEGRLDETRARVEGGRALEADALKVQLALDSARQDHRALGELRERATLVLGHAVGIDGPAEPQWQSPEANRWWGEDGGGLPPFVERALALPRQEAIALALAGRRDLAALEEDLRARELRLGAVRAERLPRLQATARWNWSTGDPFEDETWAEGRLGVVWTPFAAGTRKSRAAALRSELEALRADLTEARRRVLFELGDALASLRIAHGNLEVGETGITQTVETLRVEQERYGAGRATTNDLLEAEAAVRQRRTQRDVARLDLLRAFIQLQLALGAEDGADLLPPGLS